ncbi:MAG: sugar ABC transporter substrate-binding protein [Spirochaetales bacterium]|nr:sugar ABC transporter substrate-binding protein [Spirochaetales bacterium]
MRRVLLLAVVAALSVPLVFAGGKGEPAAAEEAAAGLALIDLNKPVSMYERVAKPKYVLPEGWKEAIGDTKELTFINSGPLQYDPAMAEGMKIFSEMTGIKLNAIEISEELLHTKQSAMMRARSDKLDLVFTTLSTEAYYDYQAAGWLESADLLYDDQIRSLYSEDMLDAMTIDGKIWGFPYIGGAFVYGYRKDIFEKEGLKPPKTWDELLVIARKLTRDGMYGFAFPAGPSYDTFGIFCSFLSGAGGELMVGDKVVVNSPQAVEALQVMVDLRNRYKVVPEGVNTYSLQQMGELLAAGRIASFVSTSWTYQFVVNTDMWENFAMTLYPAKAGVEQTVYQDTSFYSVSPYSKSKAAAYLFLDFLRSYEERKLELLVERNVIYNREVWKDPDINEESVPFYQVIKSAVDRAKIYVFPNSQKIVDLLNVAVEKALSGSVTPKEALDEVQTKVDILQF